MKENLKQRLKRIPLIYRVNSKIKSYFQEKIDTSELLSYSKIVYEKHKYIPDQQRIEMLFRDRISYKGSQNKPKKKGDLHILLIYPLNNWEVILPKTLEPFGTISEFEIGRNGFNVKSPDWINERDRMNKILLEYFYHVNSLRKVDVVISYLSGITCDPKILKTIGENGPIIFNFWWDDKIGFKGKFIGGRWSGPAAIASVVDLNLTNAPDSVIKYMGEGGLARFWPEAAQPQIHKPYDIPFEFDVSVLGGCYGWRPLFVQKLQKKGINITCFGNGWPNGPLSDEESVKLFSRSKINLGFAGVGHSKYLMCLKGRDFEVPMSGGLYLTQDNPELSLVYDVGNEIITYNSLDDCFNKICWLLDNPDIAEQIRLKGMSRATNDHTWEKRFDEIFQLAGLI